MTPVARIALELRDYHPAQQALALDVLRGLGERPKRLSPLYFYDERGSQLFERICELPEYYLTRTETGILERHGPDIARLLGDDALLVELGSGASIKTRLLLDCMPRLAAYVPVDISRSHLLAAARRIAADYPCVEVLPVCADFTQPFSLPRPRREAARVVFFFPGSTLGNFDRGPAIELLQSLRETGGVGSAAVIGADLVKSRARLEAAYDDAAGVTAEFNLNVLRRLNHEFAGSFDLDAFAHEAVWVAGHERIEMRLVSLRDQDVAIAGETIRFARGERLVTEHCHKYTPASFAALASAAGWEARQSWQDAAGDFSVQYLEAPAEARPE
jgi:dimethylhistidine N-methyltransferase